MDRKRVTSSGYALVAVETSVYYENETEEIKSDEVAKRLHGDDGIGDEIVLRDRLLEKDLLNLSTYKGLNEISITFCRCFLGNGKNSTEAFMQGQAVAFSSGSTQTIWFLLMIMTLLSTLWLDTSYKTIKGLADWIKISDTLFSSPRLIFPRSREPSTVLMDTSLSVIFVVFFILDFMTDLLVLLWNYRRNALICQQGVVTQRVVTKGVVTILSFTYKSPLQDGS
jgi:hypothetical protein